MAMYLEDQNKGLSLFVSQSGTQGWPKGCPTGFSQHLGAIEANCEIQYCVKSNVFNLQGLPIVRRPPYLSPPAVYNYSVPMLLVNEDTGQIWFKRAGNMPQWLLATKSSVADYTSGINTHGPAIVGLPPPLLPKKQKSSQSSTGATGDGLTAGAAAGLTFGVTALAGLVIVVMVIGLRRHKSVKRDSRGLTEPLSMGYGTVTDGTSDKGV